MLYINAAGWYSKDSYGNSSKVIKRFSSISNELNLFKNDLFEKKTSNFGRFDTSSRKICLLSALTLQETYGSGKIEKCKTGILGIGSNGSNETDINYFTDFLEHGEQTGRSNLFIYTLPTSPLAEAAIYFKLEGPLLYLSLDFNSLSRAFQIAGDFIINGETEHMLVTSILEKEDKGICLNIGQKTDFSICRLDQVNIETTFSNIFNAIADIKNSGISL